MPADESDITNMVSERSGAFIDRGYRVEQYMHFANRPLLIHVEMEGGGRKSN